jgi:DNA-binding NarL/FixJ family response regulator
VFSLQQKILIADDHALVRDGLKLILAKAFPQAQILEAGDAESMLRATRSTAGLGVAVVDLSMPGMELGNKLDTLAQLHPNLPLVVLSAFSTPDVVHRTLEVPTVYAFVPKSASANHMCLAVQGALQGIKMMLPLATEYAPWDVGLTPRLREILVLVRQGKTNKQIARVLNITEGTVKNRVTEIFRALNVSNRTQAAQYEQQMS